MGGGGGWIPRPVAHESITLTIELPRLAVATLKPRREKATRQEPGRLKQRKCWLNSFSVTALIRQGSVGRKACDNLPGVGIRLYVKCEGDACIPVSE